MRLVGLTGGIGSGKSTVSSLLAERGAVVIDADAIVRELQEPGRPVLAAMVERWGSTILFPDGTLDRKAMARIVFADADELKALEAIVHPALRREIERRIDTHRDTDDVVVLDMALIVEKDNPYGAAEIIVVDLPHDLAVHRLVGDRGFDEADARQRIDAQVSRDDRLAIADHVIDNSGDLDELERQVDALWGRLSGSAPHAGR